MLLGRVLLGLSFLRRLLLCSQVVRCLPFGRAQIGRVCLSLLHRLLRRVAGLIYVPDRERGEARQRVMRRLGLDQAT